ncbi:hypothetical protein [Thermococcus profundus]|nr:hypothetical protein [Thermococcus profundus]
MKPPESKNSPDEKRNNEEIQTNPLNFYFEYKTSQEKGKNFSHWEEAF